MAAATALLASKTALRKAMYAKLRTLSETEIKQQSEAVVALLHASPFFQRSKSINCFLHIEGEVDTAYLAREILRTGKTLYVPKILSNSATDKHMDMFQIYSVADLDALPSGVWGIKEPDVEVEGKKRPSALQGDGEPLDLIITPGMAFDNTLARLGHGGGYYDRFIATYSKLCEERGTKKPIIAALSLREQLLTPGEIPMEEYDQRIDLVVTPDGVIGDVEKANSDDGPGVVKN